MVYLFLAFSSAGSVVVAAAYVLGALGPFGVTFLSLAFGVLTASLATGRGMWRTARSMDASEWRMLFLQAFVGITLFRVCLAFGLRLTSAAEAGILLGCTPAITAILTRAFLKEALSLRAVCGIAMTLMGILILQGFPFKLGAFTVAHLAGNLLALCSAFCEAVFSVTSRRIQTVRLGQEPRNPVAQAGLVSGMALLLCLVPALLEGSLPAALNLGVDSWIALFWYGGMATIAAFAFMFIGARSCDGYTIAAFSGLMPLSSLLLSIVFLRESVELHQWLGCACIIAAILIMARRPAKAAEN